MFSTESHVGRLIELRIRTPITDEEAQQISLQAERTVDEAGAPFAAPMSWRNGSERC